MTRDSDPRITQTGDVTLRLVVSLNSIISAKKGDNNLILYEILVNNMFSENGIKLHKTNLKEQQTQQSCIRKLLGSKISIL